MAKNDQFDKEELFTVDAPDVEGADAWDDWDDMDVDVAPSEAASSQEDAPSIDEEEAPQPADAPARYDVDEAPVEYEVADASEDWGDDDWGDEDAASFDDDVDLDVAAVSVSAEEEPEEQVAIAEERSEGQVVAEEQPSEEVVAEQQPAASLAAAAEQKVAVTEPIEQPIAQPAEATALSADELADELDIDLPEEEAVSAEDDGPAELDVSAEELAEFLPPEPSVQPETPAEEPLEETVSAEEQEAAVDEALSQPEVEKSAEEIQREQEELEAYRSAMGESNAEMADVSEYRTFRKKTKTESKSNVPKKSDFDLFANRYKVRTMNAMVAAADPIVYFYNACLRPDGSILAFNVYQVLQDRFIGKMVPQLFTAVAENSNKIEDLNEANLIEQLKVCAEFPQYDFIISVSARFFTKPALLERFLRLVPEGGVPNLVLAFDCTSLESIAIAAKAGLGSVRQRGVKILLDNTEKVTMTVLSEFDYDYIRIDSRYYEIGNPRAEAYLRLLLGLTKEQNVSTIACFCDTEDLSEYMFFMGVDAVQGNAVSRPMRTVPNSVKGITLLPSMLDA